MFTWYAILLYNTIQFYKHPSYKHACIIGIALGLLALTRPTDIVACIIPLCWNMHSFSFIYFKEKWTLIKQHYKKFIIAFLIIMAIVSLQLFYWKYVTGHWFYYSYGPFGFNWLHPKIKSYFFNAGSGLLIYTPSMAIVFVALFYIIKNKHQLVPITLFALITLWYVTAWEVTWYGGRAMVQSYAILIFPIAYFIEFVFTKKWSVKFLLLVFFLWGAFHNLWFTLNVHGNGLLNYPNTTKVFLKKAIYKFSIDKKYLRLHDTEDFYEGVLKNTKLIFPITDSDKLKMNSPYTCNKTSEYEYLYSTTYQFKKNEHLRFSAKAVASIPTDEIMIPHRIGFIFSTKDDKHIKENCIKVEKYIQSGDTTYFTIDASMPRKKYDKVRLYIHKDVSISHTLYLVNPLLIVYNKDN
jgi:hypothetical protein